MRKIFEILTHRLVFINRTTLQLCLFFILQAPLIFSLVYTLLNYERFLNESIFRYISIGYIIPSIWIFYKSIDSKIISRAKDNFEFQKYINCSADFYKAISKKEQRKIYDSIIKDITKKGLKFSSSKTNYNSVQKDFINLVNSENFKQRVLYTLDFERFTDIINLLNGKTWIRETFRYKNEFRNSINITLSKLVKQQEKVSLEEISNIIINNINISENGVILIEKELKTEIDIILVKNKTLKEKTTASNQANEVKLIRIAKEQRQVAATQLLQEDKIVEEALEAELVIRKQKLISFLKKWLSTNNKNTTYENFDALINCRFSDLEEQSLISDTSNKRDLARILFQLRDLKIFTESDLKKIYEKNIISRHKKKFLVKEDFKKHTRVIKKDNKLKDEINLTKILKELKPT